MNARNQLIIKIGTRTAKQTVCWYDEDQGAIQKVRTKTGMRMTDTERRVVADRIYTAHPGAIVFGASGGKTGEVVR